MAQDASGHPAGVSNDKLTTGNEPYVTEFGTNRRYGAEQTGKSQNDHTS